MNNIKFRVWNGDFYEEDSSYWVYQSGELDHDSARIKEEVVQLCTGLKSKNNQEIYEGDILTYILQKDGEILQIDKGIVEWSNAAFILNGEKFGKEKVFLGDYVVGDNKTELEIVGNIFEMET